MTCSSHRLRSEFIVKVSEVPVEDSLASAEKLVTGMAQVAGRVAIPTFSGMLQMPRLLACQNIRMISGKALSEAEFDRLDAFLLSDEAPSDAMDTSMLDGYLAAVVSGPNLVMPDHMLRWIWDTENGEESPEFTSNKEAQSIIGLIIRHYQNINDTLNDVPQDYEPRLMEREHEGCTIPIIDEWCMGYYFGISADLEAWTPLLVSQPKLFSTILLYGTQDGWQTLKKKPFDDAQHQMAADSLAESVRQIHAFWLDQRRQQIARGDTLGIVPKREPVRNLGKVGRNEPCPCGSGRKFKHCHGGSGTAGPPTAQRQWLH